MLKQRVLTAVVLAAGILLAIFLCSAWAWGLVVSTIVGLALREWCALVRIGRLGLLALSAGCVTLIMTLALSPGEPTGLMSHVRLLSYVLGVVFWICVVPVFLYRRIVPLACYWRYAMGLVLVLPAGIAMLDLHRAAPALVFLALLLVSAADIFAYFVGRSFGRHKLAPAISPGKTWEGVLGAVAGVLLFCVLVWVFIPEIRVALALPWVIGLALLYVPVCVMGDLLESLVKRNAGVKDSGTLLPGHGGVLDRVDAMLAFFPFAGVTLLFVQLLG